MMCQDMGMIAEKLKVLWPVLLGGAFEPPPCSLHTVLQAAAYRVKYAIEFSILKFIKTNMNI